MDKEAKARLKINKLLEDAGWCIKIESGQNKNPTLETLMKIAKAFKIRINELVGKSA
jgi:transcriptional regulator with XRE-family HTH domain